MAMRVITVRMPAELHKRLQAVAEWSGNSMKEFAVAALTSSIRDHESGMDEDSVETASEAAMDGEST